MMYRALQSFPGGSGLVHAGTEIDLPQDEADELIAEGLVEPVSGDDAARSPAAPTVDDILDAALFALRTATPDQAREFFRAMAADPEIAPKVDNEVDRQEKLIAAIDGLEKGNEAHWTQSGVPQVSALEAATGLADVTAAERDAAWEEYQAAKEGGE